MKKALFLSSSLVLVLANSALAISPTEVLFSPRQGEEAFQKMYQLVAEAQSFVQVTLYSWSDFGFDNAVEQALSNGAKVQVVMHPPLARSSSLAPRIKKLEGLGAEFKVAPQNMHEKFFIIDDQVVINSSANLSSGAKTKYSENIVFHYPNLDETLRPLLYDFKHEFAVLWNTAADIITQGEKIAPSLDYYFFDGNLPVNIPRGYDPGFFSSSQNFSLEKNKKDSSLFAKGRYYSLERLGGTKNQETFVKDTIITEIRQAKRQILVGLNHFNIKEISDELIEAVKRGVDVRLAVDNQEFKTKPNGKEMTPQFIADFQKLKGKKAELPVRVKYYSHSPSPRYWLLNHHKFILIDYSRNGRDTVLLSGSYNVSMNAEHNQFDNMVVYKGSNFQELFEGFKEEFDVLWDWNREQKEQILSAFLTPVGEHSYRLHGSEAVSLTWDEIFALRKEVQKIVPGLFYQVGQNRDCRYYNAKSKIYEDYDAVNKVVVPCK